MFIQQLYILLIASAASYDKHFLKFNLWPEYVENYLELTVWFLINMVLQ